MCMYIYIYAYIYICKGIGPNFAALLCDFVCHCLSGSVDTRGRLVDFFYKPHTA